jgi:hypothetical protein
VEVVNSTVKVFIDWELHITTSSLMIARAQMIVFDCLLFYALLLPWVKKSFSGNPTALAATVALVTIVFLALVSGGGS